MDNKYIVGDCSSLSEVKESTSKLDVASKCPIIVNDNGVQKTVENFAAIYNNTVGQMCSAVTPRYNLIQHKQYIDTFAQTLERLNMKYKMIIKNDGNKVYADISFVGHNYKFKKLGEEFVTGIRLINSYDKSLGLGVAPRLTRLACSNGMILTRQEEFFSIKHTSALLNELEPFIEKRINSIINQYDELQTWVSNCMTDSLEWNTCCLVMAKLFEQMKHREAILKNLGIDIIVKTEKNKKPVINYIWTSEDKKKDKISRWDLYNAVTAYLTHSEHITPHIENLFHKKAERLLVTPLLQLPGAK